MARITVVTGPPCAGKSTYVQANRAASDVVVDYDALAQALGADTAHDARGAVRGAAFAARAAAINYLLSGDAWGYVIHTSPNDDWSKRYADAGARIVTVNPGLDACLSRAESDGRPAETSAAIHRWFDTNA